MPERKIDLVGPVACPCCKRTDLRVKDLHRTPPESCKLRTFSNPDASYTQEVSVPFLQSILQARLHRICRIGTATIERWFHDHLDRQECMFTGRPCPEVLGIDEHFFSKKLGYVTTFCDLKKHRVFELAAPMMRWS
ncbi:MAG: hypothetical protein JXR25_09985 [Pontiellaceae bacterium]|nr:hypothetical protein [Pontiellaceae bacterium]MBN2785147.1 hypothetical protein [Pontiellaceae bacterium]